MLTWHPVESRNYSPTTNRNSPFVSEKAGPNPLFDAEPGRRRIRSFVLREGRLTPAQQRAINEYWPLFGVENAHTRLDLDALFQRSAPRVMEIGFGDGDALLHAARTTPETDFLGVEVHRPGVGALLANLDRHEVTNVRVLCADANQVLNERISSGALAGVRLFFPDPWPKKRHHKRRIVQPEWVKRTARALAPGGVLHMATDWEPYAEHMLETARACDQLKNLASDNTYCERPEWRPLTKFERRGQRLGHGVWDLLFERV